MQIHTGCFNPFHPNCYFLTDEATGSTVVIVPGCYFRCERARIQRIISLKRWHIERGVATHLHVDHVFGASFMTEVYGCPLEASPQDNHWIEQASRCRELGLELRMPIESVTHGLYHGDTIHFGKETLSVFSVSGHSPGSLVFYHVGTKHVFTGDTLFKSSIGRTDLPGGNEKQPLESIRHVLFSFPNDTIVCPGHYEPTTIGAVMHNTPFFL